MFPSQEVFTQFNLLVHQLKLHLGGEQFRGLTGERTQSSDGWTKQLFSYLVEGLQESVRFCAFLWGLRDVEIKSVISFSLRAQERVQTERVVC